MKKQIMKKFKKENKELIKDHFIKLSFLVNALLAGALLNMIAVSENGGRMPVLGWYTDTDKHFGFYDKSEVSHYYLTDIFPARFGDYISIFSIGDAIMVITFVLVVMLSVITIKKSLVIHKRHNISLKYFVYPKFKK